MTPRSSESSARARRREDIERKVAGVISETIGVSVDQTRTGAFVLSGARAFSSFALLELIIRLEEEFQLDIPDDHLNRDVFDTLRSIADYVERRLAEAK